MAAPPAELGGSISHVNDARTAVHKHPVLVIYPRIFTGKYPTLILRLDLDATFSTR